MPNEDSPNIFQALGRLEGKVDVLIYSRDGHEKRIEALETRAGSMEVSRAKLLGMAAAAGAVVSLIISILHYVK